jgi:ATP-dependent Lon protease
MIAQALALHLTRPKEEIQIVHNPENPERPFVEVKNAMDILRETESREYAEGELVSPTDAPTKVAEELGYRCARCGEYSNYREIYCPECGALKNISARKRFSGNPFGDIMGIVEMTISQIGGAGGKQRVSTTRKRNGKEEVVVYERAGENIKLLSQKALEKRREFERQRPRKVLVPINRNPFVLATGASETELLGDVRHDPYGGHMHLGTPPYERVVAGAIHEAHEGVLFLDELPILGHLQRFILTAMQEKRFTITGRNPQSAGASVRVDNVPCDFIFVGACNIQDLPQILSPLRSRIQGSGYEILIETVMENTEENHAKLAQFVAQEISMDGRIPHAARDAIIEVIKEAKFRAKKFDDKSDALTLRLRELGGLVRTAGDLAVIEGAEFIRARHIKSALKLSLSAEEQIKNRYGSYYGGLAYDVTSAQRQTSPYPYWSRYVHDDKRGYE